MKTKQWVTGSGYIEINITSRDAAACSHSGACDADVLALSRKEYIKKQTDIFDSVKLADCLKEYGAWDENELKDHAKNIQRVLWIAACDIAEDTKFRIKSNNENKNI